MTTAILSRTRQSPAAVTLSVSLALGLLVAWPATADVRVAYATAAGLVAGLATAVGAAPVFAARKISLRVQDIMLGFGAGVMLAASAFSLIVPGIAAAEALWGSRFLGAAVAATGILAGALALWAADRYLPHQHVIKGVEGADAHRVRQIWLFVFAITLHNFPEGLAVGVSFGGDQLAKAASLATGIGVQNMPEGLTVAVALLAIGYARAAAFGVAALTGLAEPLAALAGVAAVALVQPLLPFALTFAAGAMLFVVSHEIIPESHRNGHEQGATLGVIGGFSAMMVLDTALG